MELDPSFSKKPTQVRGISTTPNPQILLLNLVVLVDHFAAKKVLQTHPAESLLYTLLFANAYQSISCRGKATISERIDFHINELVLLRIKVSIVGPATSS